MSDSFPVFSFDKSDHVHDEPAAPAEKPAADTKSSADTKSGADPAKPAADPAKPFKSFENQPEPPQEGALGDGVPEAVRELREQRRQETPFYDPTKDYVSSGLEESADAAGLVGEEREAIINEQKRMLADFSFTTNEAREVVSLIDTYAVNRPDEETSVKWAQESWNALVRQHGQKEASAVLADAQKLVARDPRVKAILDVTGLGNHPKIVAKLVAFARSEKGRGRLK